MGGFNIGFGVGLRFHTNNKGKFVIPPAPTIERAILFESGRPMLLEDGSYFMIESATIKRIKNKVK